MENALYYTFSTIAQTLAGAIALLAAFVLYRLQILSTALDEHAKLVRGEYSEDVDLVFTNSFIVKGKYQTFLDYVESHPIDIATDEQDSYVTDSLSQIKQLLLLKKSLLGYFYVALTLTVGLVVGSVILLSITPFVNAHTNLRTWSFYVGIVWLVACFVTYILLLRKSLS